MSDNPELDAIAADWQARWRIEARQIAPRVATNWPWAPGTIAQGFLGARWNRRDGDSYATGALRAATGPNSPIRGGDDASAAVDVPSGARRA